MEHGPRYRYALEEGVSAVQHSDTREEIGLRVWSCLHFEKRSPHYSIHGLRVHTLACTVSNETHVIIFVPHCQLILIDVQYST